MGALVIYKIYRYQVPSFPGTSLFFLKNVKNDMNKDILHSYFSGCQLVIAICP